MEQLLALGPTLVIPIIMLGAVGVMLVYSHKQRTKLKRDHAHYQAGPLAGQLGMRLEKGDPYFNLFVPDAHATDAQHVDVLMRGERDGVPIELIYFRKVTKKRDWNTVHVTSEWQVEFAARTSANFGHFEVSVRNPESYAKVRPFFERPMPELATGDPRVDSVLRLTGDNPAIAAPLGALLLPLASLHYVHVVAEPGAVKFLMSHGGQSRQARGLEMIGVSMSLPYADVILGVLTSIVRTAQG